MQFRVIDVPNQHDIIKGCQEYVKANDHMAPVEMHQKWYRCKEHLIKCNSFKVYSWVSKAYLAHYE